jgi:hypothetical protein
VADDHVLPSVDVKKVQSQARVPFRYFSKFHERFRSVIVPPVLFVNPNRIASELLVELPLGPGYDDELRKPIALSVPLASDPVTQRYAPPVVGVAPALPAFWVTTVEVDPEANAGVTAEVPLRKIPQPCGTAADGLVDIASKFCKYVEPDSDTATGCAEATDAVRVAPATAATSSRPN